MSTRRDFIAFTVGAVAARTVLPIAARAEAPNPDAELLRLGASFRAARPAELAAWDLAEGEFDDHGPFTRLASAASDEVAVIVDQVAALPARTLAGLLVKMVALDWLSCGDPVSADIFNHPLKGPPADDDLLILSILGDLEALACTGSG